MTQPKSKTGKKVILSKYATIISDITGRLMLLNLENWNENRETYIIKDSILTKFRIFCSQQIVSELLANVHMVIHLTKRLIRWRIGNTIMISDDTGRVGLTTL